MHSNSTTSGLEVEEVAENALCRGLEGSITRIREDNMIKMSDRSTRSRQRTVYIEKQTVYYKTKEMWTSVLAHVTANDAEHLSSAARTSACDVRDSPTGLFLLTVHAYT